MDQKKLWKILKETGILEHLTCLLSNIYAGQEATVRTGHGTTDWFQIGKGVHQKVGKRPKQTFLQRHMLANKHEKMLNIAHY